MRAEPAVDLATLYRLRDVLGDREAFEELIHIFLRDAPDRLRKLEQAAQLGDLPAFRAAAHNLKGMSGQVTANRLMAECAPLQSADSLLGVPDIGRTMAMLRRELEDVSAELRQVLEGHVAALSP